MKIQIKHSGKVVNGVKIYDNPLLYRQQLQELEGKEFIEIIKEKTRKPSNNQYGFYRGGILPTCHSSEMFSHFDTKDDIHSNYFAPKFLSYMVNVKVGNESYEIKKVRSLSEISEKEFSVFIERVIADCADNGIHILLPEEYYNKHYNL